MLCRFIFWSWALILGMGSAVRAAEIQEIEPSRENGVSRAVIVDDVPLAHTAQLLPLDSAGGIVGKGQAARQCNQLLDHLAAVLAEARSGLDQLVKVNVYVTDPKYSGDFIAVLAQRLKGARHPAITLIDCALPHADALVAVDAVATTALDPGRAVRAIRSPKSYPLDGIAVTIMPGGTRVYVAGQAEKAATLAEATQKTLQGLRATLNWLGQNDSQVVQLKAFLKPMAEASAVRAEMARFFGKQPLPPVVFVEWKMDLPIEIELIAWGGKDQAGEPVEYLTPPGMTASPIYSRVARINHSKSIYISGLCSPRQPNATAEVKAVFADLGKLLQQTGSDFRHMVKATYYVSTEAASRQLNELRPDYYDSKRPPSASKAMIASGAADVCGLVLDMIAVPAITDDRPEYGPPEFGHGLTPAEAEKGWISLFDGKTAFGWTGSKVADSGLVGGASTTEFGDCDVKGAADQPGTITLGGKEMRLPAGAFRLPSIRALGKIRLGEGIKLKSLTVRPLGLQPLFNGKDLTGWQRIDRPSLPEEKQPTWKVIDGALQATGGPGAVEYKERLFGDLVLQLDVKTRVRHANGGVFFRSIPGDFMNGYEAQVYNRGESGDPARPARYSTGALDDRQLARRLVSRDGQYFRMTIIARGPHLATWVNGVQLTDWTDERPKQANPRQGLRVEPGTIQLQAHDPGTAVEFRNIFAGEFK